LLRQYFKVVFCYASIRNSNIPWPVLKGSGDKRGADDSDDDDGAASFGVKKASFKRSKTSTSAVEKLDWLKILQDDEVSDTL
jgi:hypothetical protein